MTNLWNRAVATASLAGFTLIAATGCGALGAPGALSGNGPPKNPPFQNELSQERVAPDPQYDPAAAKDPARFERLAVLNAAGRRVTLNVLRHPILFEAYWCPHCQRTLVLLWSHRRTLREVPFLVSTGFAPGTSLKAAVRLSDAEVQAYGLQGAQVYYYLGNPFNGLIGSFPTLVYSSNGNVLSLQGEHLLSVWRQALASAASLPGH